MILCVCAAQIIWLYFVNQQGRFRVKRSWESSQVVQMELEFSIKSRIRFNGKVSDEGDIEVVVGGKLGNIKRTIGDFAEENRFGGIEFFLRLIV